MFRAIIIRGGKWVNNLYVEKSTYGDFSHLKDAIEWITEEYVEFRGGWGIVKIIIKEVNNAT